MNRTDFIAKVKAFTLEGWTSYVLITLGLMALLAIVGLVTEGIVHGRADRLTKTHILDEETKVACAIADSAEKVAFINAQRMEISAFGNSHRTSAVEFFTYFYTTYVVFTIFGLIAAISLAVITKTGINTASPHIIAAFLVCTSIVVLYQGSLGVFQPKSNLDSNAKLAVNYAVLVDQIDTYCATGKINVKDPNVALAGALPKVATKPENTNTVTGADHSPKPEPPVSAKIQPFFVEPNGDEFINFVAWQMEHLRSFSIALDDSKVSAIDNKRFLLQ